MPANASHSDLHLLLDNINCWWLRDVVKTQKSLAIH